MIEAHGRDVAPSDEVLRVWDQRAGRMNAKR